MALQSYTFQYTTDFNNTPSTVWTTLDNVVSFNVNGGRQRQLDQYKADTASIVVRYPNGYASPITALKAGTTIRILVTSPGSMLFWPQVYAGYINDLQVEYGIPYVGSVGNADYLTISLESHFARFGRQQGLGLAVPADDIGYVTSFVSFYSGSTVGPGPIVGFKTVSATTVDATYGDWLNQLLTTVNGRMTDEIPPYSTPQTVILDPSYLRTPSVGFSDTANDATNQVYNKITFDSAAQEFYTQVTVDPVAYPEQTVQTGSAPYRTLQLNTFNSSEADALNYANYLLNNYKTPVVAISSITCSAESQNVFKLATLGAVAPAANLSGCVGYQVGITFRGTTYYGVIEGWTVSGTPAGSSYTYYISGANLNAYLIFDNAVFGKLDSNRLGY
jgi:hypothetical protein